jgi:glycosyltransferase involved in cell wall biosynthesis
MSVKLLLNLNLDTRNKSDLSIIRQNNIELLVIPFPSLFGFRNDFPYIVVIPDLMHKYYPSFPEYNLRERVTRDIIYKNAAKHSKLTVVDAQQGVDDLNEYFKIPKEKVCVIPYVPPDYIYEHKDMDMKTAEGLLAKYNLPEKFLFYPAQFWHHKNHERLISALERIRLSDNKKVPLVLVGSRKDSYFRIMDLILEKNMKEQIKHIGYVSDEEIVALYKKASALVYPSLFGPTNIPPLEAMVLGTPVLCSNLFSMPDQVGDAGLLFDPFDIKDMAEKILMAWSNENLRKELIYKGYERVKDATLENYAEQWENIINETLKQ